MLKIVDRSSLYNIDKSSQFKEYNKSSLKIIIIINKNKNKIIKINNNNKINRIYTVLSLPDGKTKRL